jgi:hypothetical protein
MCSGQHHVIIGITDNRRNVSRHWHERRGFTQASTKDTHILVRIGIASPDAWIGKCVDDFCQDVFRDKYDKGSFACLAKELV